ncbi:MAG: glycine cleavage system aminomethyltransferase GcvT, partial [Planctomycetota bacterium]
LKYFGVSAEHEQVRRSGGVFDVSHMARVRLKGLHAKRLLERACTRRIGTMKPSTGDEHGQCRYTLICNEHGGIMDDVIVSRFDDDEFYVVINASNRAKIVAHLAGLIETNGWKVTLTDETEKTAMIAAQGPRVMEMISAVSKEIPRLKRYRFTIKNYLVMKLIVSRTGYTGEDGVEVVIPANMVGMAMKMLMKDVDPNDEDALVRPAGLAARDTLRLEAGMPLYGNELGEDINALATGLDFAISLDKNEADDGERFIGQDALEKTAEAGGPARVLIGLKLEGKRSARQGMAVRPAGDGDGSTEIGVVTSGCPSPTLGCSIAMAYVERDQAAPGTNVSVDTGRARIDAAVVPLPFYKRQTPA